MAIRPLYAPPARPDALSFYRDAAGRSLLIRRLALATTRATFAVPSILPVRQLDACGECRASRPSVAGADYWAVTFYPSQRIVILAAQLTIKCPRTLPLQLRLANGFAG